MKTKTRNASLAAASLMLIALLGYLTSTTTAQIAPKTEPKNEAATKWEHLAMTHDGADIRQAELSAQIVKLGNKGWELVTVTTVVEQGTTTKTSFYFKRPKQ